MLCDTWHGKRVNHHLMVAGMLHGLSRRCFNAFDAGTKHGPSVDPEALALALHRTNALLTRGSNLLGYTRFRQICDVSVVVLDAAMKTYSVYPNPSGSVGTRLLMARQLLQRLPRRRVVNEEAPEPDPDEFCRIDDRLGMVGRDCSPAQLVWRLWGQDDRATSAATETFERELGIYLCAQSSAMAAASTVLYAINQLADDCVGDDCARKLAATRRALSDAVEFLHVEAANDPF